jgi:hypothetical protein
MTIGTARHATSGWGQCQFIRPSTTVDRALVGISGRCRSFEPPKMAVSVRDPAEELLSWTRCGELPQREPDLHQRSRRPDPAIQLRHMWLWVTSVIGLDGLRSHDLCHQCAWLVFTVPGSCAGKQSSSRLFKSGRASERGRDARRRQPPVTGLRRPHSGVVDHVTHNRAQ